MKRLLVVWHSHTGGARQMAQAAADAARAEDNVEVGLLHAPQACADDVLAADGYVFATPENLATMAGLMKDFFDRIAAMICAGSDGAGAARQIERIATGLRLKAVAPPLIVITHAQTPEAIQAPKTIAPADLARCAELGAGIAAGMTLGVF